MVTTIRRKAAWFAGEVMEASSMVRRRAVPRSMFAMTGAAASPSVVCQIVVQDSASRELWTS